MDPQKDEKKDSKPVIPTLRDTRPTLKIKGAQASQTLIERLKQFKKKDIAFILAGLGVLFMAPLAEHFLMAPPEEGGAFKEGWGFKPGVGGLGRGGSPFENGVNGLAPGGMLGGGADVITPLNARDPSALIMGPGATAQAPATAPTSAAAAPTDTSGWKDALAAGKAGASAAASKAGLPVPHVPLSGGGLRGLSAVSGGGAGAGASFGPMSASAVPNHGNVSDSSGLARRTNGYNGVSRGLTNSNPGGLEALKRAGIGDFGHGSALNNLASEATRNMGSGTDANIGSGSSGGPAAGAATKDAAGNSAKDSKAEGESLEFLRLKQEQEKAIDLEWKLKEKAALFWPDLDREMMKTLLMDGLIKPLSGAVGDIFKLDGDDPKELGKLVCCVKEGCDPVDGKSGTRTFKIKDLTIPCGDKPVKGDAAKDKPGACETTGGDVQEGEAIYTGCRHIPGKAAKNDEADALGKGTGSVPHMAQGGVQSVSSEKYGALNDVCKAMKVAYAGQKKAYDSGNTKAQDMMIKIKKFQDEAAIIANSIAILDPYYPLECIPGSQTSSPVNGAVVTVTGADKPEDVKVAGKNVRQAIADASNNLRIVFSNSDQALQLMEKSVHDAKSNVDTVLDDAKTAEDTLGSDALVGTDGAAGKIDKIDLSKDDNVKKADDLLTANDNKQQANNGGGANVNTQDQGGPLTAAAKDLADIEKNLNAVSPSGSGDGYLGGAPKLPDVTGTKMENENKKKTAETFNKWATSEKEAYDTAVKELKDLRDRWNTLGNGSSSLLFKQAKDAKGVVQTANNELKAVKAWETNGAPDTTIKGLAKAIKDSTKDSAGDGDITCVGACLQSKGNDFKVWKDQVNSESSKYSQAVKKFNDYYGEEGNKTPDNFFGGLEKVQTNADNASTWANSCSPDKPHDGCMQPPKP